MAYQLKTIRFQGRDCRILLQNENGPCPLLAAANCLLLQDRISLPAAAIRNNVASLSDLTNVLANFALSQHEHDHTTSSNSSNSSTSSNTTGGGDHTNSNEDEIIRLRVAQSHYQLNELLQLIPKLQDGMDVNPKFTSGITGYEYTSQLTCFDLWKVPLVHGWLLDTCVDSNSYSADAAADAAAATPDSAADDDDDDNKHGNNDFYEAIRDKTYNQLVEMVIRGHDARDKVHEIQVQFNELQQQQQKQHFQQQQTNHRQASQTATVPSAAAAAALAAFAPPADLLSGDDIFVATTESATTPSSPQRVLQAGAAPPDLLSGVASSTVSAESAAVPSIVLSGPQAPPDLLNGDIIAADEIYTTAESLQQEQQQKEQEQQKTELVMMIQTKKIQELNDKLDIYQSAATMSARVDDFLQATSHQLTHYGLQALQTDLRPNQVVVFFRNNHFSTLTKNESDGHLYLLVTDLGYCNTPLVVWEKLDDIFGNTEYVNSDFCKPDGAATSTESGIASSLSPEQLLAQSSQNDADYHLALHLSKQQQQQPGSDCSSTAGLDAQEGQLLAAATEASLREYHGLSSNVTPTTAMIPPDLGGRVEVGFPVSPPAPFTSGGGGGGTIVALPPAPAPAARNNTPVTTATMTQESADRLLAMQLAASEGGASNQSSLQYYSNNETDASYHLARQLQEEENQQAAARRQAQAAQRQQQQQAGATSATMANRNRAAAATTSSSSASNPNCTIS